MIRKINSAIARTVGAVERERERERVALLSTKIAKNLRIKKI